jgi:hypothetical protein
MDGNLKRRIQADDGFKFTDDVNDSLDNCRREGGLGCADLGAFTQKRDRTVATRLS